MANRTRSAGFAVAVAALIVAGCGGSGGGITYNNTESLAIQNLQRVPSWVKKNHLAALALPGARLFAQIGCLNCHTYLGTGGGFQGAPDLSGEGLKLRGVSWQIHHLRCPACAVPGSPMPPFGALGTARLRQLAIFLEASRRGK